MQLCKKRSTYIVLMQAQFVVTGGTQMANQTYQFLASTMGFCESCENLVQAKLVEEGGQVFLLKYCPAHGVIKELYEEDSAYQRKKAGYDQPSTVTGWQTSLAQGCPYDCGLCPCHDQHTCIGLIEITNQCDLLCPVCYAGSGAGDFLSLETIRAMLEFYWAAENGKAEILQISGGEPTLHPRIIEIIHMAKEIGFPFVMLNTNGIRIANDLAFADALAQFHEKGFEIYLQFDGMDNAVYEALRGKPLLETKLQAIKNLAQRKIPSTLVATVAKGINAHQLGEILSFAMRTDFIRGVNLQPLAYFGRLENAKRDPITLSGVLKRIEAQTSGLILAGDFIPLPCNVERVAITCLLKQGGRFIPITRNAHFASYAPMVENTFLFSVEKMLQNAEVSLSSLCGCSCMDFLKEFKAALPKGFLSKTAEEKKAYIDTSTFRISVSSFVDMRNFDLKSMQKECVHILTEDCRRIPFSAYNMLHREKSNG